MKRMVGALFLMTMIGCGGNNGTGGGGGGDMAMAGSGGGCTATLSGAVTASYPDCDALAAWDGSKNLTSVSVTPKDASGGIGQPSARIDLAGMLATGTFKDSDANASGAMVYTDTSSSTSVPSWASSVGALAGSQGHLGSYTLTLTSVTPSVTTSSVIDYDIHGSLTATLVPIAGTGATGNIDYTINF